MDFKKIAENIVAASGGIVTSNKLQRTLNSPIRIVSGEVPRRGGVPMYWIVIRTEDHGIVGRTGYGTSPDIALAKAISSWREDRNLLRRLGVR